MHSVEYGISKKNYIEIKTFSNYGDASFYNDHLRVMIIVFLRYVLRS